MKPQLTGKLKTIILAMLLASVNSLAMTSSRDKANRAGPKTSPAISESSPTSNESLSRESLSRESTTTQTTNTSRGVVTDPVYDSSVRSTPPNSSLEFDNSINKGSKRAQADKYCDKDDKACLESKKAAQESLNRY